MLYKILIVEDEPAILKALTRKFEKEKFVVLQARDGLQGLEMALKEHPDIILLDIIMPQMDGMSMLFKLRENAWGKEAKIILLTNLSDATKVSEAARQGVFDYLVKTDWHIDEVVKKVRDKLKE